MIAAARGAAAGGNGTGTVARSRWSEGGTVTPGARQRLLLAGGLGPGSARPACHRVTVRVTSLRPAAGCGAGGPAARQPSGCGRVAARTSPPPWRLADPGKFNLKFKLICYYISIVCLSAMIQSSTKNMLDSDLVTTEIKIKWGVEK